MTDEAKVDSVTVLCDFLKQIGMNASGDAISKVGSLMPCLDSIRPLTWVTMAQATFDDHPGMSAADKLRIIIKKTIGNWYIQNKARQFLARANAEGDADEKLLAFWSWTKTTFERERSFKVNDLEEYLTFF